MQSAGLQIRQLLAQHGIARVRIFSSACVRTQHSSHVLYDVLAGGTQLSRALSDSYLPVPHGGAQQQQPILTGSSCAVEHEAGAEEPWQVRPSGVRIGV